MVLFLGVFLGEFVGVDEFSEIVWVGALVCVFKFILIMLFLL